MQQAILLFVRCWQLKKIKVFYWVTGSLLIFNLPVSYLLFRMGFDATSTMVASIVISYLAIMARAIFLKKLVNISLVKYFGLIVKLTIVSFAIWGITHFSRGGV